VNLTTIRERAAVGALRWAPKGLYSAAIGWGARVTIPRPLRPIMYRAFARQVGASLDEVELPLDVYESFSQFFARRLRPGARPLEADERAIVSPCDGTVAAIGHAAEGRLIQAKGRDYALAQLLGNDELSAKLLGGPYLTTYLSPANYHRVHAPISADLVGYSHLPGTLFPVNALFSRSVDGLMATNERVVFHLQTEVGAAALVMVAAIGVSNIEITHDALETRYLRRRKRSPHRVEFERPIPVSRGEELGIFHLGSTTILIFEPGRIRPGSLREGDAVRLGQEICRPASLPGKGS
jgi:phosphatidylserine decarboxylase